MHFPALATGFRLLAKCFVKCHVAPASVGTLSTTASTNSIVDAVVKSVKAVEEVAKPSEIDCNGVENSNKASSNCANKLVANDEQNITRSMRSTRVAPFEVSRPRADSSKVQVECAQRGGVLQARVKKDVGLVTVKRPILRPVTQEIKCNEADELMDKVLRMFEEINEMEKFRIQLRVPAFNDDLGDGVQYEDTPVSLGTWIDPVKEAEIALDIARCETTVEDVDDLLTRVYIEMNRLVVMHAKDKEERKQLALEVSAKIKEYAGVLLESECEVRLAVDRARVRSVVAKRIAPSDTEYLASLAPGSAHILGCDGSCVLSYLPHRITEKSDVGLVPELIRNEGSRCSTPSEIPSTPRTWVADLQEEPEIMVMFDEVKLEVVSATSKKMVNPKMVAKNVPVRKATKVVGGSKPAWRF